MGNRRLYASKEGARRTNREIWSRMIVHQFHMTSITSAKQKSLLHIFKGNELFWWSGLPMRTCTDTPEQRTAYDQPQQAGGIHSGRHRRCWVVRFGNDLWQVVIFPNSIEVRERGFPVPWYEMVDDANTFPFSTVRLIHTYIYTYIPPVRRAPSAQNRP